jgi:large subunit ribosomal protein L31
MKFQIEAAKLQFFFRYYKFFLCFWAKKRCLGLKKHALIAKIDILMLFFAKNLVNSKKNCNFVLQILKRRKNKEKNMKAEIHPKDYRLVVFKDMSNEYAFLGKSTVATKETIKWEDGNEYPLVKLEISSASHPFFTGKVKLVDTAGRVDKFMNKYKKYSTDKK